MTAQFSNMERWKSEKIWRQLKQEFHFRHVDFEMAIKYAQGEVKDVNVNLGVVSIEMMVLSP